MSEENTTEPIDAAASGASIAPLKFNVNKSGLGIFLAEGLEGISKTGREPAFVPLGRIAKKRSNLAPFLV
jgi:hypothetical protein